MTTSRTIRKVFKGKPVTEGAGVRLKRVFGFNEAPLFDPFLLLDDFRSDNPADYRKGFPWHPHRGIETITYMLEGNVEHGDSIGNRGVITAGSVQWMTAGSGIIHQEMPFGEKSGRMGGFQLWANLPASQKMSPPRYRDITTELIPRLTLENGVEISIICGRIGNTAGPVRDIAIDPEYLDFTVPAGTSYTHPVIKGHTAFAYIIAGKGVFGHQEESLSPRAGELSGNETLIQFSDGDTVTITTEAVPVRFLLISGKPLNEPVAWYGPIVMNTDTELRQAFEEYQNGTFLKHS
ncbi:pirin family protein [Chlorobium ferrooxidans]|uniref:Pirin-like n=1 Tax=Chlorobium ferrooxidans DSM 13031 TaxID=377431 RepID=Q0YUR0_9CHLB|nr:pirin family protein [Chlorobium ferrooxidans]EAT59973.1 Pirin-like [Chlorobium ferrooxidans DSM 13031]